MLIDKMNFVMKAIESILKLTDNTSTEICIEGYGELSCRISRDEPNSKRSFTMNFHFGVHEKEITVRGYLWYTVPDGDNHNGVTQTFEVPLTENNVKRIHTMVNNILKMEGLKGILMRNFYKDKNVLTNILMELRFIEGRESDYILISKNSRGLSMSKNSNTLIALPV